MLFWEWKEKRSLHILPLTAEWTELDSQYSESEELRSSGKVFRFREIGGIILNWELMLCVFVIPEPGYTIFKIAPNRMSRRKRLQCILYR